MKLFTFDELVAAEVVPDRGTLTELITYGGFPQRVSHQDEIWRQDHVDNWLRQHRRPTTRDGERKATAARKHELEI